VPKGSSERTRNEILRAARELFAEKPIPAVSVREIAAAAGVDHALVHRYFGTREEMVAEILRREIAAVTTAVPADLPASGVDPHDLLRELIARSFAERRTAMLLIVRAELAGLRPEDLIGDDVLSPLGLMARELRASQARREGPENGFPDPALVSAVVGAAIFAFVAMTPWLMREVGLGPDDLDKSLDEIVDILVDVVVRAGG
jgi:TetR/AcrR family transcriptional regulator, repressor for neighboring sulfatase